MNDTKRKYDRKRRRPSCRSTGTLSVLGIVLTISLLTACMSGYDVPADIPCPLENLKGTYTLDLKIAAGNLSARSSGHGPVAGDAAENFINVSSGDYAVFIFDGAGNFVQRFEPGAVSLEKDGEHDYVYHINGAFRPENELDEVQIMVLANWRTDFGGDYLEVEGKMSEQLTASGRTNSLNYLYGNAADFNFTLPVTPATSGGGASSDETDSAWFPVDNTSGIPMFGLSEKIDMKDKTMLGNSIVLTTGNPIPMLRSLAKIEVVDMVPGGISANIEKCVLTTYNKTGRFIPDVIQNPNWNGLDSDKTQVTSPSLPADLTQSSGGQFAPAGKNLQFFKGSRTVRTKDATGDETKDCFTVYIPEMDLQSLDKENRPVVLIYIKGVEKPYTVELTDYDKDGKPIAANAYASLLRNHAYRYNILSVGVTADLPIKIETPDWDLDDDQFWGYEDAAVKFTDDGKFKWLDHDGNPWGGEDNKNWDDSDINDRFRILLIGQYEETAAYGSFRFKPVAASNSCTWTLSLIADDATKNDYFTIQIKKNDGDWEDCGDTVTRDLDNDAVEFRIMATGSNGSTSDYSARLIMTVQTFDGRVAILNLTGTSVYDSSDERFYYVVKQLTDGTDNM